jgi:hypothetical protein
MMSTENFRERLSKKAAEEKEISRLEASVSDHPVLPHIAIVSTALAVAGLEISVGNRNNLRVKNVDKPMQNIPILNSIAKEKRKYGFKAKSRDEAPYVVASIDAGTSRFVNRLPTELSHAVLDNKRWVISESKLEIVYPPEQNWLRTLRVGVVAVHCGYSERSKTDIDKIVTTTDKKEFDDLFALIFDTEEVEEDNSYYRGDQKTMIIVETVTNDPERHFDMHEAMGIPAEQLHVARTSFNAIATFSEIPNRVSTSD